MNDVVYFELNNWFPDKDYPDAEPFLSWMGLPYIFRDNDWCVKNQLCIVETMIDMSNNFCITASRKWVEENCPDLLAKYTQFLRHPDPRYDNEVYGQFDCTFKEWKEENFGYEFIEEEW